MTSTYAFYFLIQFKVSNLFLKPYFYNHNSRYCFFFLLLLSRPKKISTSIYWKMKKTTWKLFRFWNFFKFLTECRKPHLSSLGCLEMTKYEKKIETPIWQGYREYPAKCHQRNRHISASRNDNLILKKVPERSFKPILYVLN